MIEEEWWSTLVSKVINCIVSKSEQINQIENRFGIIAIANKFLFNYNLVENLKRCTGNKVRCWLDDYLMETSIDERECHLHIMFFNYECQKTAFILSIKLTYK